MNKDRRKALLKIISQLEEIKSDAEGLQEEELQAYENMSDRFDGGEKLEKLEQSASELEEAVSLLESAIESLQKASE